TQKIKSDLPGTRTKKLVKIFRCDCGSIRWIKYGSTSESLNDLVLLIPKYSNFSINSTIVALIVVSSIILFTGKQLYYCKKG
ncbi:MAG TPA: hypothetical protein PLB49_12725, partial [Chitinophagaceae bacterium]|nr:hypothetical protein [Chitinophagaceae bacterium]